MEIRSSQFIKGIIGTDVILEDDREHFAFVGSSNVGKSSVINSLLGTRDLVKSSSRPGKTQQINFFLINEEFYVTDLPGYGYAKIPIKRREKLRKLILWYLASGEARPKKVALVIDIQVGLKDFDKDMLEVLGMHGYDVVVVANKADKLKQGERIKQERKVRDQLPPDVTCLLYSAKTHKGRKELSEAIFE